MTNGLPHELQAATVLAVPQALQVSTVMFIELSQELPLPAFREARRCILQVSAKLTTAHAIGPSLEPPPVRPMFVALIRIPVSLDLFNSHGHLSVVEDITSNSPAPEACSGEKAGRRSGAMI